MLAAFPPGPKLGTIYRQPGFPARQHNMFPLNVHNLCTGLSQRVQTESTTWNTLLMTCATPDEQATASNTTVICSDDSGYARKTQSLQDTVLITSSQIASALRWSCQAQSDKF